MGGIPNPLVGGWVQWLAGGLSARCSTCGSPEHTRGQICPTVLAERQASFTKCWVCGEEFLGQTRADDVREADGSLQTYYSWQHANGDTCTMPRGERVPLAAPLPQYQQAALNQPANHLEYWARERERNEREALNLQRQGRWYSEPIETRSIEEQQRARMRDYYLQEAGIDPRPKKLPIIKPTKRKFNFDAQS